MVKMTLWQIHHPNTPTFYLDAQVQGILDSTTAAKVAADVMSVPGVSPSNVMPITYEVNPGTGYEQMTTRQLETLICAHVDLDEIDKNDALILGKQLIEWSRR